MAERPIFIPTDDRNQLVRTEMVEFQWFPGMAKSQKQKSIRSLHESAKEKFGLQAILEISSKSELPVGVAASAFNLKVRGGKGAYSVENIFQSSKVFEGGVQYKELLYVTPMEAKRDERIRGSGRLVKFRRGDVDWPLEPKTVFYDWVYINALQFNPDVADQIMGFDAFSDIEFNPKRSFSCQAFSAALFKALTLTDMLDAALSGRDEFIKAHKLAGQLNTTDSSRIQKLGL